MHEDNELDLHLKACEEVDRVLEGMDMIDRTGFLHEFIAVMIKRGLTNAQELARFVEENS